MWGERGRVNAQVDATADCALAGYIHALGAVTGSLDNYGTGVLSMQLTESIVGCAMASDDGNTGPALSSPRGASTRGSRG